MAKKLTEEQQKEVDILLENNRMLETTKKEVLERGGNTGSVKQIERAQQEVVEHIKSIDPTAIERDAKKKKQKIDNTSLFGETDLSLFFMNDDDEEENKTDIMKVENEAPKQVDDIDDDLIIPSQTVESTESMFNNIDPTIQYDVIQLPSNGQCYKNKVDRVPVAYLTAYDENIITSPNLYKDGLVIDFLLKNKIVNNSINVDELVSGDADAIILLNFSN